MPTSNTLAGLGEHHVYRIKLADGTDCEPLTAGKHYVAVHAVCWYINRESSFWANRMASGTLDIQLSGGTEKYQAALGTFDLKGGAKIAPVFQRPVLNERNYRGGTLTFSAMLSALKQNTVVAGLLKSASSASLGIVAGMVETATLTGPAKILGAAGADVIAGVRKVLSDTGEKREALFDFTGLEFTLSPDEVTGPTIFVLLHRGATLDEAKLGVRVDSQMTVPTYEGNMLEDGAWLLLEVRRSNEYTGVRDWFIDARRLRTRMKSLVDDVSAKLVGKDVALAEFKQSESGAKTLMDEFFRLRSVITVDGVLSEAQAALFVAQLRDQLTEARDAIMAERPFGLARPIRGIAKPELPGADRFTDVLRTEFNALVATRTTLTGRRVLSGIWMRPSSGVASGNLNGFEQTLAEGEKTESYAHP